MLCSAQYAEVLQVFRAARYPAVFEVRWFLRDGRTQKHFDSGLQGDRHEAAISSGFPATTAEPNYSFCNDPSQVNERSPAASGEASFDCLAANEAESLLKRLLGGLGGEPSGLGDEPSTGSTFAPPQGCKPAFPLESSPLSGRTSFRARASLLDEVPKRSGFDPSDRDLVAVVESPTELAGGLLREGGSASAARLPSPPSCWDEAHSSAPLINDTSIAPLLARENSIGRLDRWRQHDGAVGLVDGLRPGLALLESVRQRCGLPNGSSAHTPPRVQSASVPVSQTVEDTIRREAERLRSLRRTPPLFPDGFTAATSSTQPAASAWDSDAGTHARTLDFSPAALGSNLLRAPSPLRALAAKDGLNLRTPCVTTQSTRALDGGLAALSRDPSKEVGRSAQSTLVSRGSSKDLRQPSGGGPTYGLWAAAAAIEASHNDRPLSTQFFIGTPNDSPTQLEAHGAAGMPFGAGRITLGAESFNFGPNAFKEVKTVANSSGHGFTGSGDGFGANWTASPTLSRIESFRRQLLDGSAPDAVGPGLCNPNVVARAAHSTPRSVGTTAWQDAVGAAVSFGGAAVAATLSAARRSSSVGHLGTGTSAGCTGGSASREPTPRRGRTGELPQSFAQLRQQHADSGRVFATDNRTASCDRSSQPRAFTFDQQFLRRAGA